MYVFELSMLDFRFFIRLRWYTFLFLTISAILNCQFVFDRSCFGVLFDFLLFEKIDQRNCIKVCVKNEIIDAWTIEIWIVWLWCNRFKEGREHVNVDPGRPSTSTIDETIEAVMKIILNNRWINIRVVTDVVGICNTIFTDILGIKHAAAMIGLKVQNFDDDPDSPNR